MGWPSPSQASTSALEAPASPASPLSQRAQAWPQWRLPAPLERPQRNDLIYPSWFAGTWQVHSDDLNYTVRFGANGTGAIVGDRAFNAQAIGSALLGTQLQGVTNDPTNPNRQLARLIPKPGLTMTLESTVVGRSQQQPSPSSFLADELALQLLHGPGDPRVSRVETLSRYQLQADGRIEADQWQATYPSPELGLAAQPTNTAHYRLILEKVSSIQPPAPGSDPAT